MYEKIEVSLPTNLEDREFRVIVYEQGGYKPLLDEALRQGSPLDILVRYEDRHFFIRAYARAEDAVQDSDEVHLEGTIGELLDADGNPTGSFVNLHVIIELDVKTEDKTCGSLYMWNLR